jgi:acyl transferase domain-containing protein
MLAPDGRCKTLDSTADGYVRAEACGVLHVVGQSPSPSGSAFTTPTRSYGDQCGRGRAPSFLAVSGASANQDGRSSGLTAPNGPAQTTAIRLALASAGGNASDVTVLEMHGTGTALGDPIEVGAAAAALSSSDPFEARSIHWSPYDRVGVVNADP